MRVRQTLRHAALGATHDALDLERVVEAALASDAGIGGALTLMSRKKSRHIQREVYLLQQAYVLKRYVVHGSWLMSKKQWRKEHELLNRFSDEAIPKSFGYVERRVRNDLHVVVYLKECIPGVAPLAIGRDRVGQLAETHARLHRLNVVPLDTHPSNYVVDANDRLRVIDFDRARIARFNSIRFIYFVAREFLRVRNCTLGGDADNYDRFLKQYFGAVGEWSDYRLRLFRLFSHYWAIKKTASIARGAQPAGRRP